MQGCGACIAWACSVAAGLFVPFWSQPGCMEGPTPVTSEPGMVMLPTLPDLVIRLCWAQLGEAGEEGLAF